MNQKEVKFDHQFDSILSHSIGMPFPLFFSPFKSVINIVYYLPFYFHALPPSLHEMVFILPIIFLQNSFLYAHFPQSIHDSIIHTNNNFNWQNYYLHNREKQQVQITGVC